MQKKYLVFVLAIIVLIGMLGTSVIGLCATTKPSKPIVLRYADPAAKGGLRGKLNDWALNEITTRTDGMVRFEEYYAGSLLGIREIATGVNEGAADIGFVVYTYTPEQLPLWTHFESIMKSPSLVDGCKIYWRLHDEVPAMKDELTGKGLKLLSFVPTAASQLFTNKPIRKLADIHGLKLISPSDGVTKLYAPLGAVTSMVAHADTYAALEKGSVDGVAGRAYSTMEKISSYEVVDYVTEVNVVASFHSYVISINKFNSLPAEYQQVIVDVFKEFEDKLAVGGMEEEAGLRKKFQDAGCEIIKMPSAEMDKWAAMPEIQQIQADWVIKMKNKGLPGQEVMDKFWKFYNEL